VQSDSLTDLRGTRAGEYIIEAPIGEGAHGAVWRATHALTGEAAALKIIRVELGPDAAARLVREARAARRVRHRNVVGVHDVGQLADRRLFLAMEFIEGVDLDLFARGRRLGDTETLALIAQLADGLEAMHAADLVHRDLKPGNVMVDRSGRAVIIDLGLARQAAEAAMDPRVTREGFAVGTPGFAAPEQLWRVPLDRRVDVHALGMIAVRLLTGATPHLRADAANDLTTVVERARERPFEVRELLERAGVRPRWTAALERATAFDRDSRQARPAELVAELTATSTLLVRARPRRRVVLAVAAAAGIGAVAAGIVVLGGGSAPAAVPAAPEPAAAAPPDAAVVPDAAPSPVDAGAVAPARSRRRPARASALPAPADAGSFDIDQPLGPR
jgi:serine/threonine protein kinase